MRGPRGPVPPVGLLFSFHSSLPWVLIAASHLSRSFIPHSLTLSTIKTYLTNPPLSLFSRSLCAAPSLFGELHSYLPFGFYTCWSFFTVDFWILPAVCVTHTTHTAYFRHKHFQRRTF